MNRTMHSARPRGPLFLLAAVSLAVMAGGCGRDDGLDRREVSGTVTFNGENVGKGTITLFPTGTGPTAAGEIADGKYVIPRSAGPVPGEYRVEITGVKATGRMIPIDDVGHEDKTVPEVISFIPVRFNSMSELSMTVPAEEDAVRQDFNLAD